MKRLIDDVLDPANLRLAWEEVAANQGMPGVDGVSVARWNRNWEERLVSLAADVRANCYRPARLRVRRIPKRRRGEWRVLRIPTLTDRVIQRATYHVLADLYEPVFLDCSFGYRRGRGLREAVQRVLTLRECGRKWVLDADIDAFFDRVDHHILLELLRLRVDDPIAIRLVEGWLAAGRTRPNDTNGIPMGSPISPLLANVYLHSLDCGLVEAGWSPIRYADDFVVLAYDRAGAQQARDQGERILANLKLNYEPAKTAITSFERGFDFLGVRFHRDRYSYLWQEKTVGVEGPFVDPLFSDYGPRYEDG
jgi:group II intron reverse transcriptase/maturase